MDDDSKKINKGRGDDEIMGREVCLGRVVNSLFWESEMVGGVKGG